MPRSATIAPNAPSATARIACTPKRVASTRSNAVGVPPRWMWPSTATRASLPVRCSISLASICPTPPKRTWPNASRSSTATSLPVLGCAPSATTTIGEYLVWNLCSTHPQTCSMSNGCSGIRMTFAPPASPACSAIQPAFRPITSTISAR